MLFGYKDCIKKVQDCSPDQPVPKMSEAGQEKNESIRR
jgi:hypothetical protein